MPYTLKNDTTKEFYKQDGSYVFQNYKENLQTIEGFSLHEITTEEVVVLETQNKTVSAKANILAKLDATFNDLSATSTFWLVDIQIAVADTVKKNTITYSKNDKSVFWWIERIATYINANAGLDLVEYNSITKDSKDKIVKDITFNLPQFNIALTPAQLTQLQQNIFTVRKNLEAYYYSGIKEELNKLTEAQILTWNADFDANLKELLNKKGLRFATIAV